MSDAAYNEGPAMMAARGQTYGKRKQQEEAQRAVPMSRSPVDVQGNQPVRPMPAVPGSLVAPSARPNEPITAGAPFGPGPSPMELGMPTEEQTDDDALREIRAIYMRYPSQELADIIQFYEESLIL
jgi:hypothetical protein